MQPAQESTASDQTMVERQSPFSRMAGLLLVLMGGAILIVWGSSLTSGQMVDFGYVYYHSRVLIEGGDPYMSLFFLWVYWIQSRSLELSEDGGI